MLITSSESLSYTLDLSEKVLGILNLKKSLDPARYCTTFMPEKGLPNGPNRQIWTYWPKHHTL